MKRSISVVLMFTLVAILNSCKMNAFKNLEYENVSNGRWLQASVQTKNTKTRVLWFQVFDQLGEQSTIDSYKNAVDKIDKYPANVSKDKWAWILINSRIEIRLLADNASKEFQNSEKMKRFLFAFDLDGLENITGEKVDAKELKKYLPKLD